MNERCATDHRSPAAGVIDPRDHADIIFTAGVAIFQTKTVAGPWLCILDASIIFRFLISRTTRTKNEPQFQSALISAKDRTLAYLNPPKDSGEISHKM